MKNNLAAVFVALFALPLFSQTDDDVTINPFWSFYSENYLDAVSSGRGSTGIGSTGNLSSVYHNPASVDLPMNYQVDIQYTYRTNQDWLRELNIDDLYLKQNPFSGSIGIGIKFGKNFQTGFLYGNPNSHTLNIGEIIETNEFGQETGRYNAEEKYIVHSFSIPLVYNLGNLRLGLNLNYSLHRRHAGLSNDEFTGKFDRFNIQSGIIYKPVKQLSIGVTFVPEATGKVTGSSNATFPREITTATIPLKAGAGLKYTFNGNGLSLSGDFVYRHTSSRDALKSSIPSTEDLNIP
jgi:hypothetical protein